MRLYLDTVNLEKKNLSKNHTAWANFKEFNSLVRCLVHQSVVGLLEIVFSHPAPVPGSPSPPPQRKQSCGR